MFPGTGSRDRFDAAPVMRKRVLIVGISSDIGGYMAERYARDGYRIVGTYRSDASLDRLRQIPDCTLFQCDLSSSASIDTFINGFRETGTAWDELVFLPNTPLPIKPFFETDFAEWKASVDLNFVAQLRLLHALHAHRAAGKTNNVVFFAAGGVNNAVVNFSAYSISKIGLIKMCEYLDAECPDLNIFIVGPGWVKTKTHTLILANTPPDDPKHVETLEFLRHKTGTELADIYDYVRWLCDAGKAVSSGRNFSVVGDPWKKADGELLAAALRLDHHMFKLRRHRNDYAKQEK